jgi:hypothetical protein
MIQRCEYQKHQDYHNYGGRGITVCERWRTSFETFMEDMGPRPSKKHSVERKNTDGNYEPSNCYWATQKTQQRNRRNNRLLTFQGKTATVAEWAESIGITQYALHQRLKSMSVKEALTYEQPRYEHNGLKLSLSEWADRIGMDRSTLDKRINSYGWPLDRALSEPVRKMNTTQQKHA